MNPIKKYKPKPLSAEQQHNKDLLRILQAQLKNMQGEWPFHRLAAHLGVEKEDFRLLTAALKGLGWREKYNDLHDAIIWHSPPKNPLWMRDSGVYGGGKNFRHF